MIGALILLAAVTVALIWLPLWWSLRATQIDATLSQPVVENEFRQTLAQILGGAAVLVGVYTAFRRIRSAEKTVQVAEQGQITERFSRAIEHLGSDQLTVRLGGIYELERIAANSQPDHWTVIEVLSAYIRSRSPTPTGLDARIWTVAIDIQAALTVLCRRRWRETETVGIDLSQCNLCCARLDGGHFPRADFSDSILMDADLRNCFAEHAIFDRTNLSFADLFSVKMNKASFEASILYGVRAYNGLFEGANFYCANLSGSELPFANISRSILLNAEAKEAMWDGCNAEAIAAKSFHAPKIHLRGANLRYADLPYAMLNGADLKKADLRTTDLRNANLKGAYVRQSTLDDALLEGADFTKAILNESELVNCSLAGANLTEASLHETDLTNADFSGGNEDPPERNPAIVVRIDLENAKLERTHFQGVDLSTAANLTKAQIRGAITDSTTKLPENLP